MTEYAITTFIRTIVLIFIFAYYDGNALKVSLAYIILE
jgi:hypothetical protein